jgi:hypothetical protein
MSPKKIKIRFIGWKQCRKPMPRLPIISNISTPYIT